MYTYNFASIQDKNGLLNFDIEKVLNPITGEKVWLFLSIVYCIICTCVFVYIVYIYICMLCVCRLAAGIKMERVMTVYLSQWVLAMKNAELNV